jgi:hypothetical protein
MDMKKDIENNYIEEKRKKPSVWSDKNELLKV